MKNRSLVTRRNRALLNSGLYSSGSRFSPSIPNTAVSAENSTVHSKMIGMFAGRLNNGLPLIRNG